MAAPAAQNCGTSVAQGVPGRRAFRCTARASEDFPRAPRTMIGAKLFPANSKRYLAVLNSRDRGCGASSDARIFAPAFLDKRASVIL
jgi:hypothetical protein